MPTFTSGATTVTFEADADSWSEQRPARVALQEVPGGDAFYVDQAGRGPLRQSFRMELENEFAWGALNSVLGQEGSLAISPFDTHTAVLLSASRRGVFLDGRVLAEVEFVITDA